MQGQFIGVTGDVLITDVINVLINVNCIICFDTGTRVVGGCRGAVCNWCEVNILKPLLLHQVSILASSQKVRNARV